MKAIQYCLFLIPFLISTALQAQTKHQWKEAKSAGYTYKYVTNDPMKARVYTLKNGLTVMLSENHKTPRIGVRIAVRAGSNTDPASHTGLAHYLEHLLFKGTDKFGSLDWAKEKPLLEKIEALYEDYNHTTDEEKRREIYKEIDRVSGEASKYSIANEYDKLMSSMGSQGTNAHTWVEETVYHEDIPSESLDKFLAVQAERFRNPIFRIFHTELEAVYEEKNRTLDDDRWKMQEAAHQYLFPTHNYGQQSTIGTIEHLKNPSLKAIKKYYQDYYVPNNIAIIMAGDFNADELIKKIDKSFSYMKPGKLNEYNPAAEKPLTQPIVKEVFGPSAENLSISFRTGASTSRDALLAQLAASVLSNGKAGLLDLNINKQQKAMGTGAFVRQYKDHGVFMISGSPKQDQSLEEVRDLIFGQIELLKKGQFEESLIKAIVANMKLSDMRALDNNLQRVSHLMTSFIQTKGKGWDREVSWFDDMLTVSKKELVDFANRFFGVNYVLLYKKKGEDKNIVKVDKPTISPVETNAGKSSPFVEMINNMPSTPVQPQWLDFDKDLKQGKIGPADYMYVKNQDNQLFTLAYYFKMGNYHDQLLSMAASYLSFLGTDKYTAEEISKKFYDLAAGFSVSPASEFSVVSLSGLQENFEEAALLFEHLLANCKPDEDALQALKSRIIKSRANNKTNKAAIMNGLTSYAIYGAKNPFNYTMSEEEIMAVTGQQLVDLLHNLFKYEHQVLYFGPQSEQEFASAVAKLHPLPATFRAMPEPVKFERAVQTKNQVLFADYDMVQSEIRWVRNSANYDVKSEPLVDLFNNYFGGGMGSIVFQNIREAKALAYSTFASYIKPQKADDPFTIMAYVGSQADKMKDAVQAMNELLNTLPESETGFKTAKANLIKDLETSRITDFDIINTYLSLERKGIRHDLRKDAYDAIPNLTFKDLQKFHASYLSNQPYTYCVVASKDKVALDELRKTGDLKVLSLEEIFGY